LVSSKFVGRYVPNSGFYEAVLHPPTELVHPVSFHSHLWIFPGLMLALTFADYWSTKPLRCSLAADPAHSVAETPPQPILPLLGGFLLFHLAPGSTNSFGKAIPLCDGKRLPLLPVRRLVQPLFSLQFSPPVFRDVDCPLHHSWGTDYSLLAVAGFPKVFFFFFFFFRMRIGRSLSSVELFGFSRAKCFLSGNTRVGVLGEPFFALTRTPFWCFKACFYFRHPYPCPVLLLS